MRKFKLILSVFISVICLTFYRLQTNASVLGKKIVPSPYNKVINANRSVNDTSNKQSPWIKDLEKIFTPSQIQKLDSLITEFYSKTKLQICILTLDTTQKDKQLFLDLAPILMNTLGVGDGTQKIDVTIWFSRGLRIIEIQRGRRIMKKLNEEETKSIMGIFTTESKKGEYYKGTLYALTELIEIVTKKMKKPQK